MIFIVASSGLSSANFTPGTDWAAELAATPELAQVIPGTLNFILRSAADTLPADIEKIQAVVIAIIFIIFMGLFSPPLFSYFPAPASGMSRTVITQTHKHYSYAHVLPPWYTISVMDLPLRTRYAQTVIVSV